jgi:hypothetical protein
VEGGKVRLNVAAAQAKAEALRGPSA